MSAVGSCIAKDIKEIHDDFCNESIVGIQIDQPTDVSMVLTTEMIGPPSSPYAHDTYKVKMVFASDYPFSSPTVAISAQTNNEIVQLMSEKLQVFLREHWTPCITVKCILDLTAFYLRMAPVTEEALLLAVRRYLLRKFPANS